MKIEAINVETGKLVFCFESLTTDDDKPLIDALAAQLFNILHFETFIQQPMASEDRVEIEFAVKIRP